jgi:hypothetical protein
VVCIGNEDSSTTHVTPRKCFRTVRSQSRRVGDVVAIVAPPSPPGRRGPQCEAHNQPSGALPQSLKPAALRSSGPCAVVPSRIVKGSLLCARKEVLAGLLLLHVVRVLCLPPPRAEGGPTSPLSNFPGSRHNPWL